MLRRSLPPSGERSVTDSVGEPVRRHVRTVIARLGAYKRLGRKQIVRAGSHDSAVDVDREDKMPVGVGGVQRPV
jgi:hypothetical protein